VVVISDADAVADAVALKGAHAHVVSVVAFSSPAQS
jgi:hypothetical protein